MSAIRALVGGALVATLGLGSGRAEAAYLDGITQTEGTECDQNAIPIAGTSGIANARSALSTTAQTYAAASYAEAHVLPSKQKDGVLFSTEFFQMVKAAEIPSYESKAGKPDTNCPANYRVSLRPVDLQAMAMGVSFQKGAWGGFYAASVAYGNPAMPNNAVRGMLLFAQPMYASVTLAAAPLARNGFTTQQGASAFALDWVLGGTYTSPAVGLRAGYAGSRGFYANIAENNVGLFVSGLLGGAKETGGLLGFFRAGVDRANANKLVKGAGLTSLYLRDLPFGVTPSPEAVTDGGLLADQGRLQTAHLMQQNIGKHVDVAATWATRPISTLYDASLAIHTASYIPKRGTTGAPDGATFMAKAGMVSLPAQATLGIEGGRYFSGRIDGGIAGTGKAKESYMGGASLMLNDPELMALYPYAVNSLTIRFYFDGSF